MLRNRKRNAAPISPEMAPEAPTTRIRTAAVDGKIEQGAGNAGKQEEGEEAQRIGAPRDRRAEGQQPGRVDEEVREVAVHELVRHERGDRGNAGLPADRPPSPLTRAGMNASAAVSHASSSAGSTQRKR